MKSNDRKGVRLSVADELTLSVHSLDELKRFCKMQKVNPLTLEVIKTKHTNEDLAIQIDEWLTQYDQCKHWT